MRAADEEALELLSRMFRLFGISNSYIVYLYSIEEPTKNILRPCSPNDDLCLQGRHANINA